MQVAKGQQKFHWRTVDGHTLMCYFNSTVQSTLYLEIIKVRINFVFQENGRAFRSRPLVEVDPKCLLYVQQREFAATTPEDRKSNYYNPRVLLSIEMWFINKIQSKTVYSMYWNTGLFLFSYFAESVSVIGSDDATTCHLVVLRHTGNCSFSLKCALPLLLLVWTL